jgi:hypothetical protein
MHSGFTIKLSRSACLGGLSAEDLRVVRDYEERNKTAIRSWRSLIAR